MLKTTLLSAALIICSCKSLERGSELSSVGGVRVSRAGVKKCNAKKKTVVEETRKGGTRGAELRLKLVARAFNIAHASILAAAEYERITGKSIGCGELYDKVGGRRLLTAMRKQTALNINGTSVNVRATAVASTRQYIGKLLARNPEAAVKLVDVANAEFQERTSLMQGSRADGSFRGQRMVGAMADVLKIMDGALDKTPAARAKAPHAAALPIALETLKVATGVDIANPSRSVRTVQQALASMQKYASTAGADQRLLRAVTGAAVDFETASTKGAAASRMARANPGQIANAAVHLHPQNGDAVLRTLRTASYGVLLESATVHNSPIRGRAIAGLQASLPREALPPGGGNTVQVTERFLKAADAAYRGSNNYIEAVAKEYRAGRRGPRRAVVRGTGARGIR